MALETKLGDAPMVDPQARVLYVDKSEASTRMDGFLKDLGIVFTTVEIENPETDPRGFRALPLYHFISRGGYEFQIAGEQEIRSAQNAILSDYKRELRELAQPEREKFLEDQAFRNF